MKHKLATILFFLGAGAALYAAPDLCLTTSAVGPVLVAQRSKGYTGFVTVSSQRGGHSETISVTVDVGGNVPNQITSYAHPNGTATISFMTGK